MSATAIRRYIMLCEETIPSWLSGHMYHGTARRDLAFHRTAVAYFTYSWDLARRVALEDATIDAGTPRVIQVKLTIQRPAKLDMIEMQDLHALPDRVAELQNHGYDCAIYEHDGEVCVFGNQNIHVQAIIDVYPTETERRLLLGK